MDRGQERVERDAKRPRGQGGSSGAPFGAQSSSRAPPVQGSSMPGPSASHPNARGSLPFPPPAPGSYFECGEFGHIWRQCPRRHGGGLSQQRSRPLTSAPVTSPPTQSARGGSQSPRGRPRGGGRSWGGLAHFYTFPARPDAIASDAMITSYYRLFMEEFSSIASSLTKLTQKGALFRWSDECEKSFQKLKTALTTAPVLVLPSTSGS
ncbi:uncharacterized protein [Nicotiana tomentosiformis]|uniref:uncharacterized protein n=1 Tax=Nicotiana tomentosiformis TaxID=4098 RepID=UPI00388CB0DE